MAIWRPNRVTGNRRDSVEGAGWEFLFVAVDDHARIAFTAMHPDERTASAVQFLARRWRTYAGLVITVRRLLPGNVSAFRSRDLQPSASKPCSAGSTTTTETKT